jgi:hypothetical protein
MRKWTQITNDERRAERGRRRASEQRSADLRALDATAETVHSTEMTPRLPRRIGSTRADEGGTLPAR